MFVQGDVANRAVPEAEAQTMVADDLDAGDVDQRQRRVSHENRGYASPRWSRRVSDSIAGANAASTHSTSCALVV
jgi:hypothetical protein